MSPPEAGRNRPAAYERKPLAAEIFDLVWTDTDDFAGELIGVLQVARETLDAAIEQGEDAHWIRLSAEARDALDGFVAALNRRRRYDEEVH